MEYFRRWGVAGGMERPLEGRRVSFALGWRYTARIWLWAGALSTLGCTPYAGSLDAEDVPAPAVEPWATIPWSSPTSAEPALEQHEQAPEELEPEPPTVEPGSATVHPSIAIRVFAPEQDPSGWPENDCEISVEKMEGFPAYDPDSQQVVTVESYDRGMSSFDDEIVVKWIDANTGASVHSVMIVGDHGSIPCDRADMQARRRVTAVIRRLAQARWEAMAPVPIRLVHDDSYDNYIGWRKDPDADPEEIAAFREELMPRGQVHAVVLQDEFVVRLPGVEVLERQPGPSATATISSIVAHRRSGTVLLTETDCRDDEDCTCNTENTSTVQRWSARTLAAVDRAPCSALDDRDYEDDCEIASIFG